MEILPVSSSNSTAVGLAVPTFLPYDDPIACINKAIAFLSAVFSLCYPSTNKKLESSSNPRNQATIQDGRVTVQQVQGRQGQNVVGSGSQGNAAGLQGNTSGQANAKGKELDKEQLPFLVDPKAAYGQVAQTITHNAAFQTDDLDAYDSNCDDISSAKAVLMANLSSCDSDVLSEFIDSQMDDMIRMKNRKFAAFETEIDTLKQTLSKHVKEKESLITILNEIVNIVLNSSVVICDSEKKNDDSMVICNKCLELEAELVKKNDVYIELLKRFSNLEQHCISIEVAKQLNQEIFQKNKSCDNQNDPEIQEYFKQNDLKVQLQAKDTVISKLKETIHSLRDNANPARVKQDTDEIETINIELEHNLKAQIQENIFANATLKIKLRKLKRKNVIDTAVSKPNATTIAPGMFKLDLKPLAPKVVQIILWYLDSGCSKHMIKNRSQLTNFVNKLFGTVNFGNDQTAKIMGYGDYQIGNVTISRVYYVKGLRHNLFSVVQFCDSDLEVAFRKHICFVRNLESVDLLMGSWGTIIYIVHWRYDEVKFLRSKDEAPEFIIKFLKMIQVRLNATVRNIRTDNGIEFVNQTLRSYYEDVTISRETSVARTP
ncbi:integrase, catalytic region, zinc finger, CCHC-type containing protein [Tanacetum coccineum]